MDRAEYGNVHESARDQGAYTQAPGADAEDSFRVVVRAQIARGDVEGALQYMGRIPLEGVELIEEFVSTLIGSGYRDRALRLVAGTIDRAIDHYTRALLVVMAARYGLDEPVRDRIAALVDKRLEKDPARLEEICATVSAAVMAAQAHLVERVLAATAKQLTDRGLKALSNMLLAEGHVEASLELLVAKAKQGSAVTMLYLMDMLRAAERPNDADRLFCRVLAADPARAPATLMAMRNIGRIKQVDRLFAEAGMYSAAAGVRLCQALTDQPPEYTDAVMSGLAKHSLDTLVNALSAESVDPGDEVARSLLLIRPPGEVAAAVGRMTSQAGEAGVDLLMAVYAQAPQARLLECAAALIRGNSLDPALTLLGEYARSAEINELIDAASFMAQTDIGTFRTFIYIAFTRSGRLTELVEALRRTRRLDVAMSLLRDLVRQMPADQLAELLTNLVDHGADELFEELARTAAGRADFAELITNMHGRGHHRLAYRLRGYSLY